MAGSISAVVYMSLSLAHVDALLARLEVVPSLFGQLHCYVSADSCDLHSLSLS